MVPFRKFLDDVADTMRINRVPETDLRRYIETHYNQLRQAWRTAPKSGYKEGIRLYHLWWARLSEGERQKLTHQITYGQQENPLPEAARTAMLIGAMITTALGVVLIYQAAKPPPPLTPGEAPLPNFTPPRPQIFHA